VPVPGKGSKTNGGAPISAVSTHVLDTALGQPGAGVQVVLQQADGSGGYRELGRARTDQDGRAAELGPATLEPGTYRLVFDTGAYFAGATAAGEESGSAARAYYFPEVVVTFTVTDGSGHYHTPLLLSPFGYSTYRGT